MTLRELIHYVMDRGLITKTLTYIHQVNSTWHEKPMAEIHRAYTNVVRELLDSPGKEDTTYKIVVDSNVQDGEDLTDVYLIDVNGDRCALDFTDWNDLIDLPIEDKISRELTQMLGHVLYEITWWGFTNESIRQQREELIQMSEDTDNLIPFEGLSAIEEDSNI